MGKRGPDHYETARDAALERFRARWDADRLGRLGAHLAEEGAGLTVPSLCWEFRVERDPFSMRLLPEDQDVSITWQVLVLDYLAAPEPVPPRGFVSFADIAAGRGYQAAFENRVTNRLLHTAGAEAGALGRAMERLGGTPTGHDPVQCIMRFFPLFEFQVVRYEGDEDFPPFCNVLLPDNVLTLFSIEDGIVAAERLVAALGGRSPAAQGQG